MKVKKMITLKNLSTPQRRQADRDLADQAKALRAIVRSHEAELAPLLPYDRVDAAAVMASSKVAFYDTAELR